MQKLAQICIRRPVFATMLIMALVVMGLDAYRKLGVDFFPKIEFPIVTITTTLRGAAPEEVETQVTKRIEEAVNTISGIDELRSTSAEGVSHGRRSSSCSRRIADVAAQEVRDKIAAILSQLAAATSTRRWSRSSPPTPRRSLNVVVASGRDLREITKIVDDRIKKNIESLNGVGQVRFVGDRKRQIQVWLDGEKLYSYNLNIDQVRAALAAQNVEIPGGRIDQGARELSLRTLGRVEQPQDFERIIVANVSGAPVRISDIGDRGGRRRGAALAGAAGRQARRGARGPQAVRHQHARRHPGRQGAHRRAAERPCRRTSRSPTRATSPRFIEESFKAVQEHLVLGGFLAGHHRAAVHPELALHADRRRRHSDLDHLHLHADAARWASR